MAKIEDGKMRVTFEADHESIIMSGEGKMKQRDAFFFYLHMVECVRQTVQKTMPENYGAFRGGVMMALMDPEEFSKSAGIKDSIMFDMSKMTHEHE